MTIIGHNCGVMELENKFLYIAEKAIVRTQLAL